MLDITGTYTDQYQLTMAQVYFSRGLADQQAVFDYFFRELPFGGGYAVFAGLEDLLEALAGLRFTAEDLEYLGGEGFDPAFVRYLGRWRFRGSIRAAREGDLVFPTRPVLQVEGGLLETQIVETLVLNLLNFQTLIATKASRLRVAAGERRIVDFGLRRAPGLGGYHASRAALVGGVDATSNVRAGRAYGVPIAGTMAHSLVQSYDAELDAFRDFAAQWPENCVLLVDTYDTLGSGLPNAITVAREMEARGQRMRGIRLDSGDLAWLSKRCRRALDDAGLGYVNIAASNQLDEQVIQSLLEQGAPIDFFGVGTSLATGRPDAALDGVYKLAAAGGKPRIKLSEASEKVTLPDRKQVFRLANDDGAWVGADVVALEGEGPFDAMHHPFDPRRTLSVAGLDREPLLHPVMRGGRRVGPPTPVSEIARYARERLAALPPEYKRFVNPHLYKVGISDGLKAERDALVAAHGKRVP
jgi:nicotinate phosphoribosyltransferase